jgi:hypothetical protein
MTDLSQTLKKGTLLIVETGEYSDRSCNGPVRLLKTFTKAQLVEDFRSEWKSFVKTSDDWRYTDDVLDSNAFLPWLITSGRVEEVDIVHSWHVGSYGEFKP